MKWLPPVMLLLAAALAAAREWRSADGQRTFEATFIGVKADKVLLRTGEKATSYPLAAFAAEDRQFATNAQLISDAAVKWGPQNFEINHIVDGGWICRLALAGGPGLAKGPAVFTGELFFLVVADPSKGKRGDRFNSQFLHGAGGRTYHPLTGGPAPIRAFALDAEEATKVWMETVAQGGGDAARQSPPVLEPKIEITTTRGLGIVVGKGGLIVVDASLAKDATGIVMHHDGGHHPGTLVKTSDALGVAVISCEATLEPGRIGSKKPLELGQNVFAVNVELSSTKKTLASRPAMTRGIVSRPPETKTGKFQHDAVVPPDSIGGFIVGEKGDVLGVFFNSQTSGRASVAKGASTAPRPAKELGSGLSTAALSAFLDGVPGAGALKSSSGSGEMEQLSNDLKDLTVLVTATHEEKQTRVIAAAKTNSSGGAAGPAAGWSLSKSGTRHNAKCRYYNAALPCAATDGKPCKICGG